MLKSIKQKGYREYVNLTRLMQEKSILKILDTLLLERNKDAKGKNYFLSSVFQEKEFFMEKVDDRSRSYLTFDRCMWLFHPDFPE